jgi:hypothetical protein
VITRTAKRLDISNGPAQCAGCSAYNARVHIMTASPDQWATVERLYHAALAQPIDARRGVSGGGSARATRSCGARSSRCSAQGTSAETRC